MSKHTPGPWKARELNFVFNDGWNNGTHSWSIDRYEWDGIDCFCVAIAHEASNDYVSQETIDANARLIAAAPELLEALKETREALMAAMRWLAANDGEESILVDGWLDECQRLGIPNGVGKRSEAAIAKAECGSK